MYKSKIEFILLYNENNEKKTCLNNWFTTD